jgi:hypothetical protein
MAASETETPKAAAPDIEVTPEMIQAGTEAFLSDYSLSEWEGAYRAEEVVKAVLLAALAARKSPERPEVFRGLFHWPNQ